MIEEMAVAGVILALALIGMLAGMRILARRRRREAAAWRERCDAAFESEAVKASREAVLLTIKAIKEPVIYNQFGKAKDDE